MTLDDILVQVVTLLQRQGRVSYQALKRRFDLDDDYLEDLKAELIDAQQLAVDEDSKVLVWSEGPATTVVSASELGHAPLSYTPPHLANKILTSKSTVEGERKQVTVLFADLKGSLELLSDRDPEEARQLLASLLGDEVDLEPLKQRLIERTEGNPFFLEESVRTLVEIHALVGERGAYRLAQALPSIQVPATVLAVLAARIDRLPPEEKRLLQAAARSANREAVPSFEQALVALRHLPESRETREQAIDLRFDLRNALLLLGEQERILGHLCEAATLAEALDDLHRLGRVSSYMSDYCWRLGQHDRAIDSGQRALSLGMALEDFGLQVVANFYLGRAYITLGDYRRAMDVLKRNVAVFEGDLIRNYFGLTALPAVLSRAYLAWCLAELGAFAEGIATGEEGVRMAKTVDHPYSLLIATGGVGMLYFRKGELHQAIAMLDGGLELCRVWSIRDWFPLIASTLGAAYALSGHVIEAVPLLEETVQQATSMGIMFAHSLRVAWQSEASLRADRREDAIVLAGRAYALACEQKERGHEAYALRLLGEIAAHGDPLDGEAAAAHYQQALALADELGMRPLQAHCHGGLGTLYAKVGWQEQARTELSTAIALYRKMEMTFWLPQAEAALAQVEGR
jgi:tetratricopeptide (TPR) repeat protein